MNIANVPEIRPIDDFWAYLAKERFIRMAGKQKI